MKTLKQCRSYKGKRVLVRVDFNVPHDQGVILDDTKITESLPTLEYLRAKGAKLILVSHLSNPHDSLESIARRLERLLQTPVDFCTAVVGSKVHKTVDAMRNGDVVLLENIRHDPREEINDKGFAQELAALADIYVNEAFAVCHRAHASVVGVPKLLPSYAGLLLAQEIKVLEWVMKKPKHPLVLLLGGAKIHTKISIL